MAKKLSELYEPKPKGEKDFVDKHPVKKNPINFNKKSEQNTPGKVKTIDRSAKRMGYDNGSDEKVYDDGKTPGPNDQRSSPDTGSTIYPSGKFAEEIELTDDDIDMLLDILDTVLGEDIAEAELDETSGRDFARGVNPNHPATTIKNSESHPHYSKVAVDKAIQSSNRSGRKIGGKEAKKIHALLKGWRS